MCVPVYAHACARVHTYVHPCASMYLCTCGACVCVPVYVYAHVYLSVHVFVSVCTCVYAHARVCVREMRVQQMFILRHPLLLWADVCPCSREAETPAPALGPSSPVVLTVLQIQLSVSLLG